MVTLIASLAFCKMQFVNVKGEDRHCPHRSVLTWCIYMYVPSVIFNISLLRLFSEKQKLCN